MRHQGLGEDVQVECRALHAAPQDIQDEPREKPFQGESQIGLFAVHPN